MLRNSVLVGIFTGMLAVAASDTRLADAAEQGNRDTVRSLLDQKVDANSAQGDGSTALHWAAYKDDVEMAKMLVAAGASVKATTRVGSLTPLFMACKNGNAAMIEVLVKAGADPNFADEHGTTPLMMAAASGGADAVKVLIDSGADVNAREGAHGQTALMFAASLNRGAAIKVLMDHGADPTFVTKAVKLTKSLPRFDDGSIVPEDKPAAGGRGGRGGTSGAAAGGVSAADQKTQLDALAAGMGLKAAVYESGGKPGEGELKDLVEKLTAKVDAMEKRLPAPPPVEGGGRGGNQGGNNGGVVRERGTLDVGGMTALMYAARDGQIDAARALLEGGADINQVTAVEKTSPLVMAIANGHYDVAKFLVDFGANPNLVNVQGFTALYATIDVQWAPKGWYPSPVTVQEKVTYLDLMESLLNAGANPNARLGKKLWFRSFGDHSWIDPSGATPFWRATQSSDIIAMRLLIKHGADPDIPSAGGATPLMVAAGVGWGYHYSMNLPDSWMDAVKECIQLGANVNAADDRGYTALHGAAYLGNHEMITYLMDHGADIKAVAKDKNTVADMANGPTRFGIPHPETVALLEKLGSANSHNCRSDQCLVAPREDRKPTTATAPAPVTSSTASSPTEKPAPAATPSPESNSTAPAKKPGERIQ